MVTLVHGVEFPGLMAEWTSEESGVAITNVPPVSAAIYGSFPKSGTRTISYALNHPNRLNSTVATFTQTLRFCPQLEDDDEPTDEQEQTLPTVNEGDSYPVLSVKRKQKKTTPPARYTEATLLGAMEHPGKFLSDSQMREAVEEAGGLGTPATRAGIIEKLVRIGFLERKGDKKTKYLVPTHKGIALITVMPEAIQSPTMTAEWEQKLTAAEQRATSVERRATTAEQKLTAAERRATTAEQKLQEVAPLVEIGQKVKEEETRKARARLRELGVSNPDGEDLRSAAQVGAVEKVRLMLAAGINPNSADDVGRTPLYNAAGEGHAEVVKLLLAAPGIDVNKTDIAGWTPLRHARYENKTECAELIRAAGGHE
jgi:hypothetical protein